MTTLIIFAIAALYPMAYALAWIVFLPYKLFDDWRTERMLAAIRRKQTHIYNKTKKETVF